ncbi:two-component system histidine kinase PnpS [Amphibacillus sediminis]|uniref:two-component system histidine kinase PnpS n=1 Tax=Amphibacillus sediminis TaxID=360185 RepID=UPI00082A80A3|nr:ATP-binding protein [Amphibacillus sediminis]
MKKTRANLFFVYSLIVTLLFLILLTLILPLTSGGDRVIATLILVGGLAVVVVLFYQIYLNYIKPVHQITGTLQELIRGNYKARAFESYHYGTGRLAQSVNQLARNLQYLNRQEKMHGRQLHTVIDHMESGLMLIDEQGYVHLVNRKFIEQFGKTEEAYHNKIYYHVMDQQKVYQAVQEAFLYEQTVKGSITQSKDGQVSHLEFVGAPFFNESRELRGVVLVFHDITDLKKVEQMRKDFVANVSHELKTPITSIKGFAETLLDDELTNIELQRKFLTIIYKESDRLQALIHDLLELSKLEKEEFRLKIAKVNMTELLSDSVEIVRSQAEQKAIEIKFEVANELFLTGDAPRLKQVFLNLLYNAINYTSEGGTILLRAKQTDQWLEVQVSDTGIGIPKALIDRIFERFYRVDKARSRNTGGTGLGLAIVKHILEAHDGLIQVESELDAGSTFTVSIPLTLNNH